MKINFVIALLAFGLAAPKLAHAAPGARPLAATADREDEREKKKDEEPKKDVRPKKPEPAPVKKPVDDKRVRPVDKTPDDRRVRPTETKTIDSKTTIEEKRLR